MGLLTKEVALFNRDEKGELLPVEVDLIVDENDETQKKYAGSKVVIIPLMRGELKKTLGIVLSEKEKEKRDLDGEIIGKYCKNPSFTEKEITQIRPGFATAIVNTILFHSGLNINLPKEKALNKKETEFEKN